MLKTGEIRESDAKGRHTTTTRQLLTTENGVVLIDTPGMREIGLCGAQEELEETFQDIVELEQGCKFRDCRHESEPGCAVRAAIADGRLSEKRLQLYRSLTQESSRH